MAEPEDDLFDDGEPLFGDLFDEPSIEDDESIEQTTHLLTFLEEGFYGGG
jgi:hypothetical protein